MTDTNERDGVTPSGSTSNTKTSFKKVGRKYRPKFRENALLTTWHLNYFKPIEVPKDILLRNGLLKETITVNPLTGVVEVTTKILFNKSFTRKVKYTKDYRIWTLNDAAVKVFKKYMDIDVGNKLYCYDFSKFIKDMANNEEGITDDNYSLNEVLVAEFENAGFSNYNVINTTLPTSIAKENIKKYTSYSILPNTIGILDDNYRNISIGNDVITDVINFKESNDPIIGNRDLRISKYIINKNIDNNIKIVNVSNDLKLSVMQHSDADYYCSIVTYTYSFIPNTDDLVDFYEKLSEGILYSKKYSLDIYVDDLLSDGLYVRGKYNELINSKDIIPPLNETKYGISIGRNDEIKPIPMLSWVPPIRPIPDPIFQYKLVSAGVVNHFNWLLSSFGWTRIDNVEEYSNSQYILNGYLRMFYDPIVLGNQPLLVDVRNRLINDNYDINSFSNADRNPLSSTINPYGYLNNYSTLSYDDIDSNDNRFYNNAIRSYVKNKEYYYNGMGHLLYTYNERDNNLNSIYPLSPKKKIIKYLLNYENGQQGEAGISGSVSIYDISDNYYNGLGGRLSVTDYTLYNYNFTGAGWMTNNLYIVNEFNPAKGKYEDIDFTSFTKFVRDYYKSRKNEVHIDLDDSLDILKKIRLSDGYKTTTIVKDNNFDEEFPKTNYLVWSMPLGINTSDSDNTIYDTISSVNYNAERRPNYFGDNNEIIKSLKPIFTKEELENDNLYLKSYYSTRLSKRDEYFDTDAVNDIYKNKYTYLDKNMRSGYGYLEATYRGFDYYRYNCTIYTNPEPVDLNNIFKESTRKNVINSENISNHNFVFNIPLGSKNYISNKLLEEKIPLDRKDTINKDIADYPFNRTLPKMLNTYDAASSIYLLKWFCGINLKNNELSNGLLSISNNNSILNVFSILYYNFHRSYDQYNGGIDRLYNLVNKEKIFNNLLHSDTTPEVSEYISLAEQEDGNRGYDFTFNNGLRDVSDRFSFMSHLSPDKLISDDRYTENNPDLLHHQNYTDISNKLNNSLTRLHHPVYLYVIGGYESIYNRYHEKQMFLFNLNPSQHGYYYIPSNLPHYNYNERYKNGYGSFAAPLQLQTATAFALATGVSSYFYTPSPACNLLNNVVSYSTGNFTATPYSPQYNNDGLSLITYYPSLSSYMSGIAPMYQVYNLKQTFYNYTDFKEFGNKGLDMFIDRLNAVNAISNVVNFNPTNYHQFITDESYHEVGRCLTAFLLADWCNIRFHYQNGDIEEFKRINNHMVKYDINGDGDYSGIPIVEDTGTKGSSMSDIINNTWSTRIEDVYNDDVINIRKLHGGLGFSIMGVDNRYRLLDCTDTIGALFGYMNFCSPCLPFGGKTIETLYPAIENNTVRYDYVEEMYPHTDTPVYSRSAYEHYGPTNFHDYNRRETESVENIKSELLSDIDHLNKLNKLMFNGMGSGLDVNDDSVYKNSIYKRLKESGGDLESYTNDPWESLRSQSGSKLSKIELVFHFNPNLKVPNNTASFEASYQDIHNPAPYRVERN